jgi:hypothetical protein
MAQPAGREFRHGTAGAWRLRDSGAGVSTCGRHLAGKVRQLFRQQNAGSPCKFTGDRLPFVTSGLLSAGSF